VTRDRIIQRIQDALSPDLIDKHWQEQAKERPLHNYCYVASEALYHAWGRAFGFKPAHIKVHIGHGTRCNHWLLRRGDEVLDITASQFGRVRIPYRKAINCGFLTGERPSNACKEILRRIRIEPEYLANYRDEVK
jgi:hypothetical protein